MESYVFSLLILTSIVCGAAAAGKNWAVLIAGSSTYYNYRHQADICHAYQILSKNGIPDERLIVMMYDDIAYNDKNPFKGNIINRPGGPNVYPGVPKDYTGSEVTAKTFLKVLEGDQDGIEKSLGKKGKVLNSGPEDYVFIYFADHGGPGFLAMPNEGYVKARELNNVLKKMTADKKFAKLTFYVEACNSGSVFKGLIANNTNIYVTTSANPDESSYGCYFDEQRYAYLGDLYSVSWMENTDNVNIHTETLEQQYRKVKARTNTSHVQQYGDRSFTSYDVGKFLGNSKHDLEEVVSIKHTGKTVPTELVAIYSLKAMLSSTNPHFVSRRLNIKKQLRSQLWIRSQTKHVVEDIARRTLGAVGPISWALEQKPDIKNWDCYEEAVDRLFELCPRLEPSVNEFIGSQLFTLVNLCNTQAQSNVMSAIEEASLSAPICY